MPIGAWVASFVFDLASHVSSPAALATGALWLIGLGVVGALAAAALGFLDLFAIPPRTPAHRTALVHMTLNLAVTASYTVNFWWRSGTDHQVAVPTGPILLSLVALVALGVSGYVGGKLAYRYGVRVGGWWPRHRYRDLRCHGLFAVTTIVLVLLSALEVGGG